MNKTRRKFVIYALLAVAVLLAVLLSVINVINFSMAAEDADAVTKMIKNGEGAFDPEDFEENMPLPQENGARLSGIRSPELPYSARYFTFRFDEEGNAEEVSFRIAAYSKEDALAIAESLRGAGKTGWVNTVYRYRVFHHNGYTYVTVLDQGRELTPSYRILAISLAGGAVLFGIFAVFLIIVSRRLFRPLEDSDRKQRQFIAEAESEFKIPLTVINANMELIECETGSTESTRSVRRQVKKMTEVTKRLGSFGLFGEEKTRSECDLSLILSAAIDSAEDEFKKKGIEVSRAVEGRIRISGSEDQLHALTEEVVANSLKFAQSRAAFSLEKKEGRIILTASNDALLKDGNAEQVFDRFTRLENSEGISGSGLGLAFVKDIAKAHSGRVHAEIRDGVFILQITL